VEEARGRFQFDERGSVRSLKRLSVRQALAVVIAVAVMGFAIRLFTRAAAPLVQIIVDLLYIGLAAFAIYIFFSNVMRESREGQARRKR
jgi:hypothetical protein